MRRTSRQVALDVWREFGLRDVARIDIRRDRDGAPSFIEVNPLPGVHPVNSDLVSWRDWRQWRTRT